MLFFWNWPPIILGIIVLILTYGVIQGIRAFAPGEEWTWSRWWTYKYGDIFIAAYITFAAVCFRENMPDGPIAQWWSHLLLLALGLLISFWIQFNEVSADNMSREVAALPSEWYHTLVRGLLIYVVVQSAIALVLESREPVWAFILAVICLLVYAATFAYDSSGLQDHSRVTIGNR